MIFENLKDIEKFISAEVQEAKQEGDHGKVGMLILGVFDAYEKKLEEAEMIVRMLLDYGDDPIDETARTLSLEFLESIQVEEDEDESGNGN